MLLKCKACNVMLAWKKLRKHIGNSCFLSLNLNYLKQYSMYKSI